MEISGKRILIAGASGFVGSRLCERLYLDYDVKLTALVRNMGRASRIGRMKIDIVKGDALDCKLMEKLVSEADIVIDLLAGDKRSIIGGLKVLLKYARRYEVQRFIHMSSAAVYGIKPNKDHIKEEAPLRKTGNPYSDAKLRAEKLVHRQQKKGLAAVILRPRIIWGPYSSWVTSFYNQIVNNTFCLVDHGKGACNTVFIDNLIDAVMLSIENDGAIGETFFVTDDEEITWKRFYSKWAEFLHKDIKLISINSSDIHNSNIKSSVFREIRNFILSSNVKNLLVEAPLINRITRPFFRYLYELPDNKKIWIKDFIGYGRPEKNIKEKKEQEYSVGLDRIIRESGTGFTSIEKGKNILGYTPRIDFNTGSEITKEWLRFAKII